MKEERSELRYNQLLDNERQHEARRENILLLELNEKYFLTILWKWKNFNFLSLSMFNPCSNLFIETKIETILYFSERRRKAAKQIYWNFWRNRDGSVIDK